MKKRYYSLKEKIHEIIFEAETPAGKAFDIVLLILIVLSVLIVMMESVDFLREEFGQIFYLLEWIITIIFTLEYFLRIFSVKRPWKYINSFYGWIDLLSILPTYLTFFIIGSEDLIANLITIRAIRLLRIFRILKLTTYLSESEVLIQALMASRKKITVFLGGVMSLVVVIGSTMYLVEGNANSGFTSIPRSIYWAIVTVTTVGYGDIAPVTVLGQFLSAVLMIIGYGVLAVPTGIVSVELSNIQENQGPGGYTRSCKHCGQEGHDYNAVYCKYCGEKL